jgi:CheY-like chemotaxis protein
MTETVHQDPPLVSPSREHTILIVDDEELLLEAVSFDFRRKGYNVITAGCGRDAMAILDKTRVDVVLSDVRMPNGSGVELLDYVKRKNVFLPVMFITGFADISLEEAYDRGADAVFPKPFDRKALQEAVLQAIQPPNARFNRKAVRVGGVKFDASVKRMTGETIPDSKILNLGRGGFFLHLGGNLPAVGEIVEFSFDADTQDSFHINGKGVVRWVRAKDKQHGLPTGCGIEFVELDDETRKKFIALVNSVKTKALIPMK